MKKLLFNVNSHSILDVITNSSSELFVIDGDKTVETVTEILHELLDEWNKKASNGEYGSHWVTNDRTLLGPNPVKGPIKEFHEVFGNIYIYCNDLYENDIIEDKEEETMYSYSSLWGMKQKKMLALL